MAASRANAEDAPDFSRGGVTFLKRHCLACHSGKKPKAGLSLAPFRNASSLVKQRKTLEVVLRRIHTGEMPPKGRRKPTVAEAVAFVDLVKAVFDHHDRHAKPDPGRVMVLALVSRRAALNRLATVLNRLGAPADLKRLARREAPLEPAPPPGADRVVTAEDIRGDPESG